MGKLVIAVSAAVTAFIMALTAGAVFAYRTLSSSSTVAQQQPASQVSAPVQVAADPTQAQPTVVPNVSPQDAAALAAKSINRTDVYSVAMGDFKGTQAYIVTFSSGDIVYVGLQGQVLGAVAPTPAAVFSANGGGGGGGGGHHGGGGGGDGGGEHEGGGD